MLYVDYVAVHIVESIFLCAINASIFRSRLDFNLDASNACVLSLCDARELFMHVKEIYGKKNTWDQVPPITGAFAKH